MKRVKISKEIGEDTWYGILKEREICGQWFNLRRRGSETLNFLRAEYRAAIKIANWNGDCGR
jgi:hypothetical protein